VDRGAARARGDAHFAQHGHGPAIVQRVFELAQLRVDLAQRRELGEHERIVALTEAMQVEHQSTEVAVGELAPLAQKTRSTTHASTLAKARRPRRIVGVARLLGTLLAGQSRLLARGLGSRRRLIDRPLGR
jgi:hypothetical protein